MIIVGRLLRAAFLAGARPLATFARQDLVYESRRGRRMVASIRIEVLTRGLSPALHEACVICEVHVGLTS